MIADTVTMSNGTVVAVDQIADEHWRVTVTRASGETFATGNFKTYRLAKNEQHFIIRLEGEGKLA